MDEVNVLSLEHIYYMPFCLEATSIDKISEGRFSDEIGEEEGGLKLLFLFES